MHAKKEEFPLPRHFTIFAGYALRGGCLEIIGIVKYAFTVQAGRE